MPQLSYLYGFTLGTVPAADSNNADCRAHNMHAVLLERSPLQMHTVDTALLKASRTER